MWLRGSTYVLGSAGPWRVPADGRPDRVSVGITPLMALYLPSGTNNPTPARTRSGRRRPVAKRAPSHEVRRPSSVPTLKSSLPGTRSLGRPCDRHATRDRPATRGWLSRVQTIPAGLRPLPDDRRVGCRDGRSPVREGPSARARSACDGVTDDGGRSPDLTSQHWFTGCPRANRDRSPGSCVDANRLPVHPKMTRARSPGDLRRPTVSVP